MPTDTRSLFQRPGLSLKTGASVATKNNVPGVYQSQDINGRPRTGLTMVQTTPPAASVPSPVAPSSRPARTGLTPAMRPAYDPNAQEPGSFGDQNARVNAGIYDAGTMGATNAAANGTGVVVPPGTVPADYTPPRVMAPPPPPVPQTEGANPLSGDGTKQPQGSTTTLPSAAPMGFGTRGSATPAGQDANPNVGGTGPYARTFKDPRAAAIYHDYTRRLFSANTGSTAGAPDQN